MEKGNVGETLQKGQKKKKRERERKSLNEKMPRN